MRFCFRNVAFTAACLGISLLSPARSQINFPGLGSRAMTDPNQLVDQVVGKLLHENLPLTLNANDAYPTVPAENLLRGPFHGQPLPLTLETLTKPLPPGDYLLPMTFFCTQYSVHQPGGGIAYTLGPAEGQLSTAISTFLWRGMLLGKSPQELQPVSWAMQSSVPYDRMPERYRKLVDQLIPDFRQQLNGQGFARIESGYNAWLAKGSQSITDKADRALNRITLGRGHVRSVQVSLPLNVVLSRLGPVGRLARDGERQAEIITARYTNDQLRDQTLYAGQGQQLPRMPAVNGPWSVRVPGIAYMRYVVNGGNLSNNNVMQIRILPARGRPIAAGETLQLVPAQYAQSTPAGLSLLQLFGGIVNQTTLAQCQTQDPGAQQCIAQAITIAGDVAYAQGPAQAPIMTVAEPLSATGRITATPRERIAQADVSPNRTTIGVGEIVDLTINGSTQTSWSLKPPSAGVLSNQTASSATFTAFDQDTTATIKASTNAVQYSLDLVIIKPTKALWLPIQPPNIAGAPSNLASPVLHPQGACEIGMEGFYYLYPDNVSFSRVRIREENVWGDFEGNFENEPLEGHCTDKNLKTRNHWCESLAVGSIIRPGVGSRELSADVAYFHDLGRCHSIGTITYTINLQFSVRRPEFPTLSIPVDYGDLNNDAHWGRYYIHDLPSVEQQMIERPLGQLRIHKGNVVTDLPAITKDTPSSYLVCLKNDGRANSWSNSNPEQHLLIVGASKDETIKIIDLVRRRVITPPACTSLCTWEGSGSTPHCDNQTSQ